jgi:sterol desaturase/sphingolipid hydroxylase (fatty acid hydroxylase superfamily)
VPALPLPGWAATAVALVLLDYTLYLWHIVVHKVPWLWRFHLVHHADLDMDASTALRFHAAELLLSIPWRAAQLVLIGVTPAVFTLWQLLLLLSTMFHHANVRLPGGLEHALAWVLVTPRLHGIHHSAVRDETDSNWSSGFTLWDRLHGTFRDDVAQEAISIGVPAYRTPAALAFARLLTLPFVSQPPSWRLPDGRECVTRTTRPSGDGARSACGGPA